MALSSTHLDEAEISRRLANARREAQSAAFPAELLVGEPRPAAVLIPFLSIQRSWHLLFTRRNSALPEHSGQVAFPGGRADPEDPNPEYTALREAQEEIGLLPSDVRLLGRLYDFLTITNYLVTPVVGVIPWPYPLSLSAEEVSHVFTIPLDWLADPNNRAEQLRPLPPPYNPVPVTYFRAYQGEILWGASATFTVALLDILFNETAVD